MINSNVHIESFFDPKSSTITHVIIDLITKQCAVLDSVLGFDIYSATSDTSHSDEIIKYIESNNLSNQWLLETHIHADHISAAQYLKSKIGGQTAMGDGIVEVLKYWVPVFNTADDTPLDGLQFDHLFKHNETFKIGDLTVTVLHTPGHTPACVCYSIKSGDFSAVFVGDTLFAPQRGTARVDFPGGDAQQLFNSIKTIYDLPDHTHIYLCHDYPDAEEDLMIKTTVSEQKEHNSMIQKDTTLSSFVKTRSKRDLSLSVPQLIYPAIQSNMRLGDFGTVQNNGTVYLKIPVNHYHKFTSMLKFNRINEYFTVSPQINANDLNEIAAQGYKSIICNRPDNEDDDQIDFSEISKAAEKLDIECVFLPFSGNQLTSKIVDKFSELLNHLPRPIFAYCRSGTRCATAWAHTQLKHSPIDEVLAKTQQAGYQLQLTTITNGAN